MSKKYILIQNDGEIETNSFELIGASTKRNERGKIGFFGSGLKYSIAYMMRNGIDFRVYSGLNELKFSTKPESLKGQSFDRICINRKQTSYTVTMGPTWKEDWFVLREVYCNALDENSCQLVKSTDVVGPSAGKTRIYIELTQKLESVIRDWDRYFSDERTPIFTHARAYTSNLGNEDGGSNVRHQSVRVYSKTNGVIYRRGINVSEKKELLFDYECEFVNINEDRTAKNNGFLDYMFVDLLGQMPATDYVKSILRTGSDDMPCTEYMALVFHNPEQPCSDKWVRFSKDNLLVVKEICGRYTEEIQRSKKEVFLLPAYFSRRLKKELPAISIVGMGSVIGENYFSEVDKTPKMEYLLKEVLASLKQMNYEVCYPVTPVEFENEDQLGAADIKEKKIYISRRTFDLGRREIALTLMEENEHIVSQKDDETRAFQSHIFSEWLKTMENQNGLFL
jgi:hypothetical protein